MTLTKSWVPIVWAAAGALSVGAARVYIFSHYYFAGGYYIYALVTAAVAGACGAGAMATLPAPQFAGRAYLAGVAVPMIVVLTAAVFIARDIVFGGPLAIAAIIFAWVVATLAAWLVGGIVRWLRTLPGR
ncbi:MAG: hypothetical protein ACYC6I_09385 [Bacillota bacterium]